MFPYKIVRQLLEDRLRDAERQYRLLDGAQYIPPRKARQQTQAAKSLVGVGGWRKTYQRFALALMLLTLLSACIALQHVPAGNPGENAHLSVAQLPTNHVVSSDDGHDHDHEMPQGAALGEVNFPLSCSPEAQVEFNQAMALLHSFWFAPAIHSFNTVAELDPDCGMAHWGVAMSLMGNPFTWPLAGQALVDGLAAAERATGVATAREQAYVDAVTAFYTQSGTVEPRTAALSYACTIEPYICTESLDHRARARIYTLAMEQIALAYPEDTEAQVFYALALTATASPSDKSYSNQMKATEILEKVFEQQPNHPGVAHYLIHSNDYPTLAHQGLDAAQRYAGIAPAAPHALHMPSHIFTRLGHWQESVAMNLESAEAAIDELSASHKQGAGSYNALHAMDYLMYAYLQMAQDGAAKQLLDEINAIEQLDVENFVAAYALAAMPARYALERGDWAAAAALQLHPKDLAWNRFPQAEAVLIFARALGTARNGEATAAYADVERLRELAAALTAANQGYWVGQTEIQIREVEAWIALVEGENDKAVELMREAASLEDATEKHPVMPGPVVPAHELLGEMLLILGQPAEALVEFEHSQRLEPNRFRGWQGAGRAAEAMGDIEKARAYFEQLVALTANADSERARLAATQSIMAQ